MSSRALIDTNAYAALLRGDGRVADVLSNAAAVLLSPIVIGELYDGFIGGSRSKAGRAELDRFRAKSRTLCVPISDTTAEWFAELKRQLRVKGRPIPANDIWITAACMEHGAVLVSFDAHFAAIDGLLCWEP